MLSNRKYAITVIILFALVLTEGILILYLGLRPTKKLPKPVAHPAPRIAVVLDDWGYNLHNLELAKEIKQPLTISVLPNLNYSEVACRELYSRGFEIILHLPMESREKYNLEKNTIMVSMPEAEIKNIISADLKNVLYARGASNHMGSRATEDPRTMALVFTELKKKDLYFLDSYVSRRSVCLELAQRMHLGFARRDIFLDNREDPVYIKNQIYKLKSRARLYGEAIGIGHDRKTTLEVLREALPELEREGFRLVYLSELVE